VSSPRGEDPKGFLRKWFNNCTASSYIATRVRTSIVRWIFPRPAVQAPEVVGRVNSLASGISQPAVTANGNGCIGCIAKDIISIDSIIDTTDSEEKANA
jgi:hypothetical protein